MSSPVAGLNDSSCPIQRDDIPAVFRRHETVQVAELPSQLGVELPIVQAGMGGGLAGPTLAAAVSEAGGLGTIGMLGLQPLADELASARRLTGNPLAVNLLLPFARP